MKTNEVIDVIREALDDRQIRYEYFSDKSVIRTGFQTDCLLKQANVQIDARDSGVNFFVISPVPVNKEFFKEMREYLSLVNLELPIGSFNINPANGMIFLKYGLITYWLKSLPKEAVIEIIKTSCDAFCKFGDGIATIASGNSDAETEFSKAKAK